MMTTMVLQLHFGKCITDTTLEMDGMVVDELRKDQRSHL